MYQIKERQTIGFLGHLNSLTASTTHRLQSGDRHRPKDRHRLVRSVAAQLPALARELENIPRLGKGSLRHRGPLPILGLQLLFVKSM